MAEWNFASMMCPGYVPYNIYITTQISIFSGHVSSAPQEYSFNWYITKWEFFLSRSDGKIPEATFFLDKACNIMPLLWDMSFQKGCLFDFAEDILISLDSFFMHSLES